MFSSYSQKRNGLVMMAITVLLVMVQTTDVCAFGAPNPLVRVVPTSATIPEEIHRTSFSLTSLQAERGSRRRELFAGVRRIFVGAGTAAVAFRGSKTLPVFAEDNNTSDAGNTIEIQVANLDGNSDISGTIKILMKPDWAPRGVARFEVRVWRLGPVTFSRAVL